MEASQLAIRTRFLLKRTGAGQIVSHFYVFVSKGCCICCWNCILQLICQNYCHLGYHFDRNLCWHRIHQVAFGNWKNDDNQQGGLMIQNLGIVGFIKEASSVSSRNLEIPVHVRTGVQMVHYTNAHSDLLGFESSTLSV